MLFFENLVKKLENEDESFEIKEVEKFGLNTRKKIFGYSLSTPLILIGLFQIYSYTVYHKWYLLLIGMILLWLGLKQFKNIFFYSIIINKNSTQIRSGKLNIFLSNVETAVLKEMKIRNSVIPVIDLITFDRKQILIPLFMNNQIRFIRVIKEILKNKFSILK